MLVIGEKSMLELLEYRRLDEQGLLLRLPVAEGSTVFVIATICECDHYLDCPLVFDKYKCEDDIPCEHEYKKYRVKETRFNLAMMGRMGETVFLTKEEAEQKLNEVNHE